MRVIAKTQAELGPSLRGMFRLRLVDTKLQEAIRAKHPEYVGNAQVYEQIVAACARYDSGWQKNVVTDFTRRLMVSSILGGSLNLFIHESIAPTNVRRTSLQYIYPNQTPLQTRAPDSQTLDLILQLQTRTVQFPPPSAVSVGGSKTILAGSPVTLTDNGSANFSKGFVGNNITITGAGNAGNNGTFPIVAFISPTQIQYTNGAAVNETSGFSWSAGVTRNINTVGVTGTSVNTTEGVIHGVIAYVKLSSTAVQTGTLAADLQYRISFSLD